MKKRYRSPVSSDRRFSKNHSPVDHGTPERRKRTACVFETTEKAGVFVLRTLDEHVLDTLAAQGLILALERDAGLRFMRDYRMALRGARLCTNYSPAGKSFGAYGAWDMRNEDEQEAYGRWRNAMRFLRGSLGDLVVSVVCYDQMPNVTRMRELQCGLRVLVKTYGLDEHVDEAAARQVARPGHVHPGQGQGA